MKNPSCESVEVYEVGGKLFAEPIVPQEEPKCLTTLEIAKNIAAIGISTKELKEITVKQETLREAARKLYPNGCDGTNRSAEIYRRVFVEGAKWQQKQDKNLYSKEDMYKLIDDYQAWLVKTNQVVKTFKEWFESNKNE